MNTPCGEKSCPIQKHNKSYCCTGSEIDPPCADMTFSELEELSVKIDNAEEDKVRDNL